jgi:di/tricarboxylate transporter
MTLEIILVLLILAGALVLLVTEWVRMDVAALLVLGALAVPGLVTPAQALSGFSNPAVVTIWAMFILGEGLTRTGIADLIGRQIERLAGRGEARMILVIMLTAGALSAFMPNIGVAALLLPVVMDLSRRTGHPPSRLLMPLAFAALLGGLTTLIGTPPNLLISHALAQSGLPPFRLFDFTPVGLPVLLAGTVFVAFFGRHLLPRRDPEKDASRVSGRDLTQEYGLQDRTFMMELPPGALLENRNLDDSRLGLVLGMNVVALMRQGRTLLSPGPGTRLKAGDRLIVQGQLERFNQLQRWRELVIKPNPPNLDALISQQLEFFEARLSNDSALAGQTLHHADFRRRFGLNVLAIRRGETLRRTHLTNLSLEPGDRLLMEGTQPGLETLRKAKEFDEVRSVPRSELSGVYRLQERIFSVSLPPDSSLEGQTVAKSRLGDAFDFRLLGRVQDGRLELMPDPGITLKAGDELLVQGRPQDLEALRALQQLRIHRRIPNERLQLESQEYALLEAVLSPRSNLAGQSLPDLKFRDRYGLQVLAIWREGEIHRAQLRDMKLKFGDAFLLWGRREKLRELSRDPDFIVLTQIAQTVRKTKKAPLAVLIMLGVVVPAVFGWVPIAIAAVAGATLMVAAGCLTMEDAYRSIEWRSIFLIAGMLPLGIAMENTGAATFLAERFLGLVGPLGALPVLIALYVLTSTATTVIPTPVLVVLMAPIVLRTCSVSGISPQAGMMALAVAASASFTSPIAHPANVLVMGPGGYRFKDYVRMGLPLALVVLVTALLILPWIWPLKIVAVRN